MIRRPPKALPYAVPLSLPLALLPVALPVLAAIGLGASGQPAQAETRAEQAFVQLDANGNGAISRDEFLALRQQMFITLDANGDGLLTREEIETARANGKGGTQMQRSDRIWQQDANGDGYLTMAEYTAQTCGFDMADRNGDGALSPQEFHRVARFIATKK